ncbi:MAG TPA: type II toxin-antitoxin system VapC family toxin [Hyphomicrobiaceae bacterium]|nr:type II toxin-antitoxin system VapC family toxin [Hyphomicrobiaceae bacterium]
MFLLDTNVVSELRNMSRANPSVRALAARTPAQLLWMSTISVLELEIGVLRAERRDPPQGVLLRRWLEGQVLVQFEERLLMVDAVVARACAGMHVPDPRPERDALIAATAKAFGLTIVTRDTADFEPMGVPVLDPWSTEQS